MAGRNGPKGKEKNKSKGRGAGDKVPRGRSSGGKPGGNPGGKPPKRKARHPGDSEQAPATRPSMARPDSAHPYSAHPYSARPNAARTSFARSERESGRDGPYWLYGRHPVTAALANPARRLERLLLAESPDADMTRRIATLRLPLGPEVVGRAAIEALLPPGAVHQGIALKVRPLDQVALPDLLRELGQRPAVIVALDHVTDPQNVGAILRSAAAFGAAGVLTTQDHAPPEGAVLAKAASGGLEVVPYLCETNLVRALEQLKDAGFWAYGLDEEGEASLTASEAAARSVIVLGAEGEGLRRLTRERCDRLFRLPTRPPIAALNVSNAAAVALYELLGRG